MRIVVVGASQFGIHTVKKLIENKHEVLLVDKDIKRLEEIGEELDCGMMQGDGSLPSVQREAFGDHADALVLLTNVDDVNILAAVVGRSVGYKRVIPQIVGSELLTVCSELGLNDLITPHQTVARSIVETLENNEQSMMDISFDENLLIRQYTVGHQHAGLSIADLELPKECRVLTLKRNDSQDLVHENNELEEDDSLIILLQKESMDEIDAYFNDKSEQ